MAADPTRRHVLAGAGALAAAGLAGCLGGGGAGTPTPTTQGGGSPSPTSTATPEGTPIGSHPAARDLAAQPTRGPDPFAAEAVIVAFEDPSCPRCRAFEADVLPQIEAQLVEPGTAAYAFRGYPVVYPWGEPASQALESTYAVSADAFWALKAHYYATQDAFTSENVLDRTRAFLAANTDVDAGAVVDDAAAEGHGAAVQADLDAGMAAGAGRTTPHLFLFRAGRYVTKVAGSVSYQLVSAALGY